MKNRYIPWLIAFFCFLYEFSLHAVPEDVTFFTPVATTGVPAFYCYDLYPFYTEFQKYHCFECALYEPMQLCLRKKKRGVGLCFSF